MPIHSNEIESPNKEGEACGCGTLGHHARALSMYDIEESILLVYFYIYIYECVWSWIQLMVWLRFFNIMVAMCPRMTKRFTNSCHVLTMYTYKQRHTNHSGRRAEMSRLFLGFCSEGGVTRYSPMRPRWLFLPSWNMYQDGPLTTLNTLSSLLWFPQPYIQSYIHKSCLSIYIITLFSKHLNITWHSTCLFCFLLYTITWKRSTLCPPIRRWTFAQQDKEYHPPWLNPSFSRYANK